MSSAGSAACRFWRASLHALADIPPGGEVTVTELGPFLGFFDGQAWEVSFDGGAIPGTAAGGGAVLWEPHSDGSGRWRVRAVARIAIPGEGRAPVAEAWGLVAALRLLATLRTEARSARVIGDNLGIVRFGAAEGRLHHQHLQAPIDGALTPLLLAGWDLRWVAVRRRLNRAADAQATIARDRAAALSSRGDLAPEWSFDWVTRDA